MLKPPLVSIIIPTYNRRHTLPNTIQSVIRQTYSDWELIIVDDRSTDQTKELIDQYSRSDQRIEYILNLGRKGPSAARNLGIKKSRGEYIAFLDSDDEWAAHHLADSMKALQEEEVSVCFSLWWEKNDTGSLFKLLDYEDEKERLNLAIKDLNPPVHNDRIIFSAPEFFELTCLKTIHVCHINTMVFKREVIQKVGGLDERLFASEDMDFIYRVLHDYDFCLIQDYHFIYNQGADNIHNFVNRGILEAETLINNPGLVDKFTFCGIHKCRMFQARKAFIRKSRRIKCKDIQLNRCNQKIGLKYFTLGYLNQKVHRFKAVFFLIKSLIYPYRKLQVKLAVHILFPFLFQDLEISFNDLWLN